MILLSKLLKNFKKLDKFGVSFKFLVQNDSSEYKTNLGAALTVLLYFCGYSYFFYLLSLWLSNQIVPNTQQVKITHTNKKQVHFKYSPIAIGFYAYEPYLPPDIFGNKKFLIPVLQYVKGQNISLIEDGIIFCNSTEPLLSNYNGYYCINIEKLNSLSINPEDDLEDEYLTILFIKCSQQYLKEGEYCATTEEIDQFITTPLMELEQVTFIEEYNISNDRFSIVPRSLYNFPDPEIYYWTLIGLITSEIEIDSGILLNSQRYFNFVADTEYNTNQLRQIYARNKLQINKDQNLQFMYTLYISKRGYYTQIAYSKLGEILAQSDSIFTLLLYLSIIGSFYSERKLNKKLNISLLKFIYPELKQVYDHFNFSKKKSYHLHHKSGNFNLQQQEQQVKIQTMNSQRFQILKQDNKSDMIEEINIDEPQIINEGILEKLTNKMKKRLNITHILKNIAILKNGQKLLCNKEIYNCLCFYGTPIKNSLKKQSNKIKQCILINIYYKQEKISISKIKPENSSEKTYIYKYLDLKSQDKIEKMIQTVEKIELKNKLLKKLEKILVVDI